MNAPRPVLEKVRRDLAKLPAAQRGSTDALLCEHLAALIDADANVAAVRELRSLLAALLGEQVLGTADADPMDELREARERRRNGA